MLNNIILQIEAISTAFFTTIFHQRTFNLRPNHELWIHVALSGASIFVRFEFLQSIYSVVEKRVEWIDELWSRMSKIRSNFHALSRSLETADFNLPVAPMLPASKDAHE